LLDARLIVNPEFIKNKVENQFSVKDGFVLLVTEIGRYWLVPVSQENSGFATAVLVYNAEHGERITSLEMFSKIQKYSRIFASLTWLTGEQIDPKVISAFEDEINSIVPVISGDNWADYRPSRPEDFVGRQSLLKSIFNFFDSVITGQSSTRLFSIKAPSGMGKSSAIIKIRDMSKTKQRKNKYFVYAVDVRTAMSQRYVEMAFRDCLIKAESTGFIKQSIKNIEMTSINQLFINEILQEVLNYLKENNKIIVLIFDQFEELFSKKELASLFDNIRRLSNFVDSQQQNIILGFAWKTDLTIPLDHPAYFLWSSLEDRRKEFEITQFSPSEITSAKPRKRAFFILQRRKRMPQYAIMRFAKQKGGAGALEAHHERTKEKYASNPDVDTTRSKYNFHIVKPTKSYLQETNGRIETAGCKTRKDSVRFIDTLVTASPDFFKGKKREEIKAFFQCASDFLARKIGKDNIFADTVHLDEKTPHMHLCFTPITEDGRLSAKEIIGNRVQLTKWQDDFFAHMVKKFPDLERGESASVTGRRHIPTRVFKQAVNLSKQAARIQAELDNINPINAGKKKVEVAALLDKFFPRMESLETQLRKYKSEIGLLQKENTHLEKKLDAAKPSVTAQLETGKLQQEIQFLRQFYNSTPEEYKAAYRAAQQKRPPTQQR